MKNIGHDIRQTSSQVSPYLPDFFAETVLDIDYYMLRNLGIRHIVFDLDQTLRHSYNGQLKPDILASVHVLQSSGAFASVVIMTNNHFSLRWMRKNLPGITTFQPYWSDLRMIRKPNQLFYQKVLSHISSQPGQAVMIGDKVRADLSTAKRLGMYTVLVAPNGQDFLMNRLTLSRWLDTRRYNQAVRKHAPPPLQ